MRARAVVATGLAVLAAGCSGDGGAPPLPEGRFLSASQSITPRVHLFGDGVLARIDVVVDRERYDPDRIRVAANFEPYEREGEVVRKERDLGRYAHLRYEFTLRCVVHECLEEVGGIPPQGLSGGIPTAPGGHSGFGERKSTTLKAARVLYDDPEKGTQRVRNVHWPELQSVSRLNYADTSVTGIGFPFEASVTPLHEATTRASPALLGAGFLLGAVALLGIAAALVASLLRREPAVSVEAAPELSPLERALQLVEWARERPEPERREALEVLAVELDPSAAELSRVVRRLAWSLAVPAAEAIDDIIESARRPSDDRA
jgi:hypothetical protein